MRLRQGGRPVRGAAPELVVVTTTPAPVPAVDPADQAGAPARVVRYLVDARNVLHRAPAGEGDGHGWTAVPPGRRALVAERLLRQVFRGPGPYVAVGLDRVAEWALWSVAHQRPDVLVMSSPQGAERALGLLREGRTTAEVVDGAVMPYLGPAGVGDPAELPPAPIRVRPAWSIRAWLGARSGPEWLGVGRDHLVLRTGVVPVAHRSALRAAVAGRRPAASGAPRHLLVGPANAGGQAHRLARAVTEHLGWSATSVEVHAPGAAVHASDLPVAEEEWRRPVGRLGIALGAVLPATDVLLDGCRPLLGVSSALAPDASSLDAWRRDVEVIARSGRTMAMVLGRDLLAGGQRADRLRRALRGASLRTLVWCPDLLDEVPGAQWLPLVAPPDCFLVESPVLERERPVVLLAGPGSAAAPTPESEGLARVAADGRIVLRWLADLPPLTRADAYRRADIVIDPSPAPGIDAVGAMAAGRLVIGRSGDGRRRHGFAAPPVVELSDDAAECVRHVISAPEEHRALARAAAAYARDVHDGRRSAEVLARVLG